MKMHTFMPVVSIMSPRRSPLGMRYAKEPRVTGALLAMLPFALGVTMSGTAMLALVRLLTMRRWKAPALAFTLGGTAAVAFLCALAFAIVHSVGAIAPRTRSWITLVLGSGLIVLASVAWWRHRRGLTRRKKRHAEPTGPLHAAGLGAFLVGVNAKNVALTVSAATVLEAFGLELMQRAIAAIIFVVVGALGIVLPLIVRWTANEWMDSTLDRVDALSVRAQPILIGMMLVVATILIVTGVRGLSSS